MKMKDVCIVMDSMRPKNPSIVIVADHSRTVIEPSIREKAIIAPISAIVTTVPTAILSKTVTTAKIASSVSIWSTNNTTTKTNLSVKKNLNNSKHR